MTTLKPTALTLVGLLATASLAFAHNYLPAKPGRSVTTIPDISVSRAAYREITSADQVDVYEFQAAKGQELYIQMTVPLLDREKGFAPAFVLVYTGGQPTEFADPAIDKGMVVDPPHAVVDNVLPHNDEQEPSLIGISYDSSADQVFDEPFTGTRYWVRQTLTVKAPMDGTYRIGVYVPNGATGKYVLAPGKREQFGFGDLLTFPGVRMTVRQFCEQPIWPDVLVLGLLGAAALSGIGLGIYALAVL